MRRTATWLLGIALVLSFGLQASAQGKKAKKGKKGKTEETAPPPEAPEEMELLQKGHAAFKIRDYDKALGLYEQAAQKMEGKPQPHYFIGTVLKAKGDYEKAVESFRTAYLLGTGAMTGWRGAALVQIALTQETAGNMEEAKKAWEDYIEFAKDKNLPGDMKATAEKRLKAIDAVVELEKTYEKVRERIEQGKNKPD